MTTDEFFTLCLLELGPVPDNEALSAGSYEYLLRYQHMREQLVDGGDRRDYFQGDALHFTRFERWCKTKGKGWDPRTRNEVRRCMLERE